MHRPFLHPLHRHHWYLHVFCSSVFFVGTNSMRCVRWNLVSMLSSGKALGSVERGEDPKPFGASAGVLSTLGIGRLMVILSFRLVAMYGMLLNILLFSCMRAPCCQAAAGCWALLPWAPLIA